MGFTPDAEIQSLWNQALTILAKELMAASFNQWIRPIVPYKIIDDDFVLIAPDDASMLTLEHRHAKQIKNVISAVTNKPYDIRFILPEDLSKKDLNIKSERRMNNNASTNLKPKYRFENFVKGKSNELAFAAALAVSEAPGETTYNPLFLYGGVGLGKTHLMHSIGNHIIHMDPQVKVLYTSAENLMNEFISSLRERKNQEFRDKYRKIDVLLVDDIQFLSDKEGTQEEFFHTFNALYYDNKQIVISSDKSPMELKTLEERLRSRFGSGLTVDITLPDFETRTAILEKKAEIESMDVPKDVVRFIAKSISSNIRELEGALTKVTAYSKLTNQEINLEMAEKALKDMISENEKKEITVNYIQEVVGKHFNVTKEEIMGKKRTQNITYCRHISMYLCHKLIDIALLKIGKEFGGRDHTTVIHACNKIAEEFENSASLRETILSLEEEITG